MASAVEVRVAVVALSALARVVAVAVGRALAVGAPAEPLGHRRRARRPGVPVVGRGYVGDRPLQDEGDLDRGGVRPLAPAWGPHQLVGHRALVEPPLLGDEHEGLQPEEVLPAVVAAPEPADLHALGPAVVHGDGRLAAAQAGAELAGRLPDVALAGVVVGGAQGGAAADDVGVLVEVPDQHRHHVAAGEDELVAVRQRVAAVAAREAAPERDVPAGGDVGDGAAANHADGGVPEGDVHDLEGAVAEEQPRRRAGAAGGVVGAGEVEARPGAARRAQAEGVRHQHVAARGRAVRQPYRRRGHQRQRGVVRRRRALCRRHRHRHHRRSH